MDYLALPALRGLRTPAQLENRRNAREPRQLAGATHRLQHPGPEHGSTAKGADVQLIVKALSFCGVLQGGARADASDAPASEAQFCSQLMARAAVSAFSFAPFAAVETMQFLLLTKDAPCAPTSEAAMGFVVALPPAVFPPTDFESRTRLSAVAAIATLW